MRIALRILLALLGIAVVLLTVALITLNGDGVLLQLGVVDLPEMPLGQLVALSVAVGVVLGGVIASPFLIRGMTRQRRMTRRMGELSSEVHELRTLPLRGDG